MILDFASSMSGITNADSGGDQVRRKYVLKVVVHGLS